MAEMNVALSKPGSCWANCSAACSPVAPCGKLQPVPEEDPTNSHQTSGFQGPSEVVTMYSSFSSAIGQRSVVPSGRVDTISESVIVTLKRLSGYRGRLRTHQSHAQKAMAARIQIAVIFDEGLTPSSHQRVPGQEFSCFHPFWAEVPPRLSLA